MPLLIVSDEPYVPWELVWPYEVHPAQEDPEPWCMTFRLGRWLRRNERGRGHAEIPGTLSITRGACLAPSDSGLPAAQTECKVFNDVLTRLQAKNTSPKVATYDEVLMLLRDGDYDWLHAATHGTFSLEHPVVDAAIWLEDDYPLTPLEMTGTAIEGHIHQVRPGFVFNACHGGRQSWTISGLGGWATHLISSGASVFIAPIWPVNDDDALEFTRTLYSALIRGRTIGDALRDTRQQLRQSGRTAWLVYTAYADPQARLSR